MGLFTKHSRVTTVTIDIHSMEQNQAWYGPKEVEWNYSQVAPGSTKEDLYSRPAKDTLTPQGQGYVNPNYHERLVSFTERHSPETYPWGMISLKTGWILALTPWRPSKLQADATLTLNLSDPHSNSGRTTTGIKCIQRSYPSSYQHSPLWCNRTLRPENGPFMERPYPEQRPLFYVCLKQQNVLKWETVYT